MRELQWREKHLPESWLGMYDSRGRNGEGKRYLSMDGIVYIAFIIFVICGVIGIISE